jgi:hypothetical protein
MSLRTIKLCYTHTLRSKDDCNLRLWLPTLMPPPPQGYSCCFLTISEVLLVTSVMTSLILPRSISDPGTDHPDHFL